MRAWGQAAGRHPITHNTGGWRTTKGWAPVFPTSAPSLFPLLQSLSVSEQPMGKLS